MPSQEIEVPTAVWNAAEFNQGASHRWAVILAGGDGKRLLPLTRQIAGDDRPKQFCTLMGGRTLLDRTRQRIAGIISNRQTLIVLNRNHERFYVEQLEGVAPSCLLVQPDNRGTAPAIAFSLTRVRKLDPEAVVAFFPSDHHFKDEEAFARNVELAFVQAEADRRRVVLLGITPDCPEEAYGWIEPGAPIRNRAGRPVFEVRRFWEKPSRKVASGLIRRGCLWNSFVMVGTRVAFVNLVRWAIPPLLASFESVSAIRFPGEKSEALLNLYASIPAIGFSDRVLSVGVSALAVLRADPLGWSDLGEPRRLLAVTEMKA